MTKKDKLLVHYMDEKEALEMFGGSCIISCVEQFTRRDDYDCIEKEYKPDVPLLNDSIKDFKKEERKIINKNLLDYKVK